MPLVTIVNTQWYGSEALELTYKTPTGKVANELLYRHDESRLELVEQDDDDQLDAEDRARLEAAICKGRREIADGKGIPAEQVVSELWAAHRR